MKKKNLLALLVALIMVVACSTGCGSSDKVQTAVLEALNDENKETDAGYYYTALCEEYDFKKYIDDEEFN